MKDVEIDLDNSPGALARMGEILGAAGVSVEGGGAWVVNGRGVAHFLFHDGELRGALWRLPDYGLSLYAMWSCNA